MSFDDDFDGGPDVVCPSCNEEEYLDPETGLCLDCNRSLGDDEEEGDEDFCPVCDRRLNDDEECPLCESEDPADKEEF